MTDPLKIVRSPLKINPPAGMKMACYLESVIGHCPESPLITMSKREAEATSAQAKSAKAAKAAGADGEEKALTPYDAYFARLAAVQRGQTPKVLGPMLIRGIPRSGDGSDDDDEDEESGGDEEEGGDKNKDKYTKEQMDSLRYVLVTQRRNDRLDEMREFVLGDQAGHGIMMFGTSFSYDVLDGFERFKSSKYAKAKTPAEKFDLLFAYTFNLKEYDTWMHDNEGGMDGMVKGLASMWKRLLKNDDEQLGIDAEYTRPGTVEFLRQFKKEVEMHYSVPPFKFNFQ